jgi:hypothetical protein
MLLFRFLHVLKEYREPAKQPGPFGSGIEFQATIADCRGMRRDTYVLPPEILLIFFVEGFEIPVKLIVSCVDNHDAPFRSEARKMAA